MGLLNKNNIKNIKTDDIKFNKKDIKFGTVVMFRDGSAGVFVDPEHYYIISDCFPLVNSREENSGIFITHSKEDDCLYVDLDDLSNDLRNNAIKELNIDRIYKRKLCDWQIEQLLLDVDFTDTMLELLEEKNYIER